MNDPTWVSLLPPLLAIGLAIATRQVYLSLAGGLWLGWSILNGWHFGTGLMETVASTARVLGDTGNAMVIMFTLVMGALISTVGASGGVAGFVAALERRRLVTGGRGAQLLAWVIGVIIFIESNLTVLVAGSVSRPLFDRYRNSREKLAYLIDSTSAPHLHPDPAERLGRDQPSAAWRSGCTRRGCPGRLPALDPLQLLLLRSRAAGPGGGPLQVGLGTHEAGRGAGREGRGAPARCDSDDGRRRAGGGRGAAGSAPRRQHDRPPSWCWWR